MNPAAQWYFESQDLYNILCDEDVASGFNPETFKKNEILYRPDDLADLIYFVKKGRVKIFYYAEDKTEMIKSILSIGEIFGEMALSGEGKRAEYAQVMDNNTIVYSCTLSHMLNLMSQRPEVSQRVVKLIGLRMMKLERKVELVSHNDARQRVVEFLKDAAEWKGKKVGSETLIETPLTHRELSKLVGLSRQMLTRILNEMKRENTIYFDRRRILIRDLAHFH